jgi:hypothetical protein
MLLRPALQFTRRRGVTWIVVSLILIGSETAAADPVLLSNLAEPRQIPVIGFGGAVVEAVGFNTSAVGAPLTEVIAVLQPLASAADRSSHRFAWTTTVPEHL